MITGSWSLSRVAGCEGCCHKKGLELIFVSCQLLSGDQSGDWPCCVGRAAPGAVLALPREEWSIWVCAALRVPLPKPVMPCCTSFPGSQLGKGGSATIAEAVEIASSALP